MRVLSLIHSPSPPAHLETLLTALLNSRITLANGPQSSVGLSETLSWSTEGLAHRRSAMNVCSRKEIMAPCSLPSVGVVPTITKNALGCCV